MAAIGKPLKQRAQTGDLSQNIVGHQVGAQMSVVDTLGVDTIIFSQATNTMKM